jgi:hypothetical protein
MAEALSMEKRAWHYREVLRTTLKRLCGNYVRAVRKGKTLPEVEAHEQLFQIHVQYLELLRYSQMVIANYPALMEDEQCRAGFVRDALVAMAAVDGVAKVRERVKRLNALTLESHPDHRQVMLEVAGEQVKI